VERAEDMTKKIYDDTMKRLVRENPQAFVTWLLKGATYQSSLSLELKTSTREPDFLLAAVRNGQEVLLHVEFQKQGDTDMAARLLEYNVMVKREHRRPVLSYVIYLRETMQVATSPLVWTFPEEEDILSFRFGVIKLWEISAEEMLQTGLPVLLPLLPLSKDGKRHEIIDTMIRKIVATEQSGRLLALAHIFSSLVFQQEAERKWLEGSFAMYSDMFHESWVVQGYIQEGRQKGLQEGMQKGLQEGKLTVLRETIGKLIQARAPKLVATTKAQVETITDPIVLEDLLVAISVTHDEQGILSTLAQFASKDQTTNG
jgi:predicted transposase YdaD